MTSPLELTALSEHVERCGASRGRSFALRCRADAAFSFLRPKIITAAFFGLALIAAAALVLQG